MKDASPGFKQVSILGPGLIGGSVALAVRQFLPETRVCLWGRREEPLKLAKELGAADVCTTDLQEAVSGADLIVIASPVGVMKELAGKFLPFIKQDALVTDVGSVKRGVHQSLGAFLTGKGVDFIGSHPMAGSEKQGMEHATAALFKNACVVLTNGEGLAACKLARLERFWSSLGANCLELDAAEHDRLVARVSHLPHAIAAMCVHAACSGVDMAEASKLASTGFRDTTRVSDGFPSMWAEILMENREAVAESLNNASLQIDLLREMLEQGEVARLEHWLEEARRKRKEMLRKK